LLVADRTINGPALGGAGARRNRYMAACLGEDVTQLGGSSEERATVEEVPEVESSSTSTASELDPWPLEETAQQLLRGQLCAQFEFDFFTVFLKRNAKGGIGLRLKNLDGHAAVGGFSEQFRRQHAPSPSLGEPPSESWSGGPATYRGAGDIKVDDLIVAVGSLDALSPKLCPFDKVVHHLTVCNSSRDPRRGLGGVGHAASSGSYHSWDADSATGQNKSKSTQHSLLQDTICVRFARARAVSVRRSGQQQQQGAEGRGEAEAAKKTAAEKGAGLGSGKRKAAVVASSSSVPRRTRAASLVKETHEV